MDIRSDRQKGLSYVELGKKYHFSIPYLSQFEVNVSEELVELYRKLLDDNPEGLTIEQVEKYYKKFLAASSKEQTEEIARVLAVYTEELHTCPALVDSGEMLNDEGYYNDNFLEVLRVFRSTYPDCYLTLIHMRRPKLYHTDRELLKICRLNALSSASCYSLFESLLKRHNVFIPSNAQVKEIAEYLEGYPPSILNAVQECALEGVDLVCSDKQSLVDFQERIFRKYLDKINLSETDQKILTAIYNMDSIFIEPLTVILELSPAIIAESLRNSHDYNIVELRSDGTYAISPPMRVTIERKLHRYDKNEFSEISKRLINAFWPPDDNTSFGLIDIIIYSVLRSGQEDKLANFKNFLLPSHLLKAAERANQDRDWPLAEQYARRVIDLDKESMRAKSILFKALVRQETTRPTVMKEEDALLNDLKAAHDKNVYYLEGFRLWKRRKYSEAIRKFRLAIQSGDTSIPAYRDLAECYYQTNQVKEAQREINVIMKDRKINNPFILDLAAKIAISIGAFDKASEILNKQELVDRPENVAHRWATYYIKKAEYSTALEYATAACNGERVLPEMHLLRMSIAIHQGDYNLAEQEYNFIAQEYNHYSRDVREVLYTTMLLQTQGWETAEANFCKIHGKNPYTRNLRYKIVCAKLKSNKVPFHMRKELEKEQSQLESMKMFDPLCQFQCYDFQ